MLYYRYSKGKEQNKQDPLQDHQVSRLHFENRPTKSRNGVDKSKFKR